MDNPTWLNMTIAGMAMQMALDARSPQQKYRDGWERTFGKRRKRGSS